MARSRQRDRAIAALRVLARETRDSGEQRLPTTVDLARRFGVSVSTMSKAVRYLTLQGELEASPRAGIRISRTANTGQPPPDSPPPRRRRWQQLCVQVERDLLCGTLCRQGELPPVTELSRRFGVNYRTMRKVLDTLVERGELYPYQRTYRIHSPSSSRPLDTVVLIAASDREGGLRQYSPRTADTMRELETECSRSGVALVTIPWRRAAAGLDGAASPDRHLDSFLGDSPAVGFMVWTAGLDRAGVRRVVAHIAHAGRPAAVLEEDDDLPPQRRSRAQAGSRVYVAADCVSGGALTARYLLSLGHRRIAFISPVHGSSWSQRRLAGVEEACTQADLPTTVSRHVLPEFRFRTQFLTEDTRQRHAVERLLDHAAAHPPLTDDITVDTIRDLRAFVMPAMKSRLLHQKLLPLLDSASRSKATAWVCATDEVAIEALTYVRNRGLRVPRDISVMGFDDSFEAFTAGLTSYSFNTASAVRPMLDFLLRPRTSRPSRSATPVTIRGFVNVRTTTGACAKAEG